MTDTPNLPAERRAPLVAGAKVAALVPQTIEEAFRLAQAISASGMAPATMSKPEQVLIAIMAGAEVGLAPWQAVQSIAVINNRPAMWGDGLMAVVRANGARVEEHLEGEGDEAVAWCKVTRPDTGEVITRSFSVEDAKTARLWAKTGPWQSNPKRMLQMRARGFALRDGCADMLRGMHIREEVEDYQHLREVQKPDGLRDRLAGSVSGEGFSQHHAPDPPVAFAEMAEEIAEAEFAAVEAEAGEPAPEEPRADELPQEAIDVDQPVDILDWAAWLLRSLPDYDDVDTMRDAWTARKGELQSRHPDAFKQLNRAIVERSQVIAIKGGA